MINDNSKIKIFKLEKEETVDKDKSVEQYLEENLKVTWYSITEYKKGIFNFKN